MNYTPYPFQQVGIDHAVNFLRNAQRGERQLYAAPTGCGKSVVELCVQAALEGSWIVTPRDEIIAGMMQKLGDPDGDSLDRRICTPVKLRNRLLDGRVPHPDHLIFDEGHHHSAETWQQITLLTGMAPSVAYTATPYRGSSKGTREFLEHWGEPTWLITYREAVNAGYISMPSFSVLPLVDDDIVDVRAGEFDVTSLEGVTVDRLGDAADAAKQWYKDGKWDRPTIFAMPSSRLCADLGKEFGARGLPIATVSASTPRSLRQGIFRAVEAGVVALAHINIVSEGVDLKLRRLVDMAPTMSPVKWVQQLGRITRPTDVQPEYICTNRNILRHAYALEGVVPPGAAQEAERAFPSTSRSHSRVLGLEAIGRFKPTTVKLSSGVTCDFYCLSVPVESCVVEYCVVVHPLMAPLWASRINVPSDAGKRYGTWRVTQAPEAVRGFASVGQNAISSKQSAWWQRSAARFGLDPTQEVTRKNFPILPVLNDTGVRLR